jgi:DNA polymerase III epsilon subunit-like protein
MTTPNDTLDVTKLWLSYDQIAGIVDMMDHWYGNLFSRVGELPDQYLVIDLETSGFGRWDYVTQVGYVLVEGREVVEQNASYIRCMDDPECNAGWLAGRLDTTRRSCHKNGVEYHTTMELLDGGRSPVKVWETIWDLLDSTLSRGAVTVGYNGIRYDVPRILDAFGRYLGPNDFLWEPDEFFDCAAIVKGAQMGPHGLPVEGESLWSWAKRVINANEPGIKWGLSSYAIEAFGLVERYGLDVRQAHTADADCLAVHCLFDTFRNWADNL